MNFFADKTIVVPFDFSEQAIDAIDVAIDLAKDKSHIKVFHAVIPIPTLVSVDPALPIPIAVDEDRVREAQTRLEHLLKEDKYLGIEAVCEVGEPGSSIVDFAKHEGAEMIVMPSHGKSKLDRLLLGSVAERVLRLAHCPVLILRGNQ